MFKSICLDVDFLANMEEYQLFVVVWIEDVNGINLCCKKYGK